MDQSVWTKAASTAQQQTPGGSFDWQDLLAPAIGGLIGAGSSYLLSDKDDGEIIYDKYGRPVGREESSGLGKALLGGLAGAAAGLGYNSIKGDNMGEKWNTVKRFISGEKEPAPQEYTEAAAQQLIPRFPTVDRNGNPLTENSAFSRNVLGAHITGHGMMDEKKLRGYTSPDYYAQQLQAAALNKDKGGGYKHFSKLHNLAKEEYMANGLDPEDAYNAEAIRQQALLAFDKNHFAAPYRQAIEEAYGLADGSLTPYMPNLAAKYKKELLQGKNQVTDFDDED